MTTTQKQIDGQRKRCMKKAMQAIKQIRFYYASGKKNKFGLSEIPQKYKRKFKYWQKHGDAASRKFAEYQAAYLKALPENN